MQHQNLTVVLCLFMAMPAQAAVSVELRANVGRSEYFRDTDEVRTDASMLVFAEDNPATMAPENQSASAAAYADLPKAKLGTSTATTKSCNGGACYGSWAQANAHLEEGFTIHTGSPNLKKIDVQFYFHSTGVFSAPPADGSYVGGASIVIGTGGNSTQYVTSYGVYGDPNYGLRSNTLDERGWFDADHIRLNANTVLFVGSFLARDGQNFVLQLNSNGSSVGSAVWNSMSTAGVWLDLGGSHKTGTDIR